MQRRDVRGSNLEYRANWYRRVKGGTNTMHATSNVTPRNYFTGFVSQNDSDANEKRERERERRPAFKLLVQLQFGYFTLTNNIQAGPSSRTVCWTAGKLDSCFRIPLQVWMYVHVRVVLSCVGTGYAMGPSPVKGVMLKYLN
jgi:hypothetical protein